jgi:class 3 adenylate cyclase
MTDTHSTAATAEARLKDVKAFFNNGEFFRAYDLATEALKDFPGNVPLAHRAVLSLANAGATALALRKYYEFGLDNRLETDIRSLLGRLKKDQAFAESGEARAALFREGRTIYEWAFRTATGAGDPEAYYPAINAATLALFGGDADAASRLAAKVLDLLEPRIAALSHGDSPDRYWVLATALEAYLVRGDLDAARALTGSVVAASGNDYAALATTGRQLERIVQAKGLDPTVLGAFEPPTIVHFVGHMIAAPGQHGRFEAVQAATVATDIAAVLDGMRIGAAYGSLASGADILFAEALLGRGVALNIVLPFATDDFIEQSVRPAGPEWVGRFKACLDDAKTVRFATDDSYLGDDQLFSYCSGLAMGLATLCARHMNAPLMQLAVWDGVINEGAVAGTAADMSRWRDAGHPVTIIPCGIHRHVDELPPAHRPKVAPDRRDTRAMLFGDIHGFSKLTDAQLPSFTARIMGTLAFINTWGDGIFVVFKDAGRAAACALEMQEAMNGIDLAAAGLPDTLRLRLGGHLGPVYELDDPVTDRPNYYGAHVSRAARIEPITPEGCVYVTETFAAVLALHNAREFSCDYVGITEMAKHYGNLRMFLLRRAGDGKGPAVLGDIERAARVG